MQTKRQQDIFEIIFENGPVATSTILKHLAGSISIPTLNRELVKLKDDKLLLTEGNGPGTKYRVNLNGLLKANINKEVFFKKDVDQRNITERYNPFIFDALNGIALFSEKEILQLSKFTSLYKKKIKASTKTNLNKEFERLMIELSWKSSQIEGNTYDLLDTEQLLKYNIEAPITLPKKHKCCLTTKRPLSIQESMPVCFQNYL